MLKHNLTGPTGYINKELIEKYVAPASEGDKVKVFVCGTSIDLIVIPTIRFLTSGTPKAPLVKWHP